MTSLSLVTGGQGFLGRHVVDRLLGRGERVRVLDVADPDPAPAGVEYVRGSVTDPGTVREALRGVRHVYHLAALADLWAPDAEAFDRVNRLGSRTVFREALAAGVERVVHTSTAAILAGGDGGSGGVGGPEPAPLERQPGPYPRSKLLAEREADAALERGLEVVVVRPAAPVGPGDRGLGPPTRMLLGFLNADFPAYLETTMNLVDVRDAAEALVLAGERGRAGGRYLLAGESPDLSQLLEGLEELTGLSMPRRRIPYWTALMAAAVQEQVAKRVTGEPPAATLTGVRLARRAAPLDGSPARRELKAPARPLRESLRDAVLWFRRQGLLEREPDRL